MYPIQFSSNIISGHKILFQFNHSYIPIEPRDQIEQESQLVTINRTKLLSVSAVIKIVNRIKRGKKNKTNKICLKIV